MTIKNPSFFEVVTAAIRDFTQHGYDSQERVEYWRQQIADAAKRDLTPSRVLEETLRASFRAIYNRMVEKMGIKVHHPGISHFTIEKVKPQLRAELDRRIMASANLIVLNREQAIAKTLQQFLGWATSIPKGGTGATDKRETKEQVAKALKSLPFEERRVLIDQGHKFVSSLNEILASDGGALAAIWHSHWKQQNYNYREDHRERDELTYAVRGNWALQAGLMKAGPNGYTDEITKPAEEVFCLPGDSKIPFAESVEKAFRRWFSGELAVLQTDSGETLRLTTNHPILTRRGWVPAGSIDVGDDVFKISDKLRKSSEKYQRNGVSTISEVFSSLKENGIGQTTDFRTTDFNGDSSLNKNVDVVFPTRTLTIDAVSPRSKGISDFILSKACNSSAFQGSFFQRIKSLFFAAKCIVSSLCPFLSVLFASFFRHQTVCFGIGPQYNAEGKQPFPHRECADSELDAKIALAHSAFVSDFERVKIVSAQRTAFSGHVYNLQTATGWYLAEGIITHNCRCWYQYIYNLRDLPEEMLTEKGRKKLAEVGEMMAG